MLRRFRTVTLDERAERTRLLEEIEAERDLIENVRAGVAAAAKVIRFSLGHLQPEASLYLPTGIPFNFPV